jgi:hypothetical protein
MKLKLIMVFMFLLAIAAIAAPYLEWGRVYPMDGEQKIFYADATNDGVYLFGYTNPKDITEDMLTMKIESNGKISDSSVFGGNNNDWALWGFESYDGGLISIGSTNSFGYDYDMVISKSGKDSFTKAIENFGMEKGTSGLELGDSYIVVGYGSNPQTLNMMGKIVKINKSTNEVEWTKDLPGSEAGIDIKPLSVQLTTDGNFIIAGTKINFFSGITEVYVTKVNLSGEEIWTKTFTGRDYARGFEVQETKNGYLVVGYNGDWDKGWSDFYLTKIGNDGEVLWESEFGQNKSDHAYSVKVAKNGNIYVAGYTAPEDKDNFDMLLVEYNSDGEVLSHEIVGGNGDDIAYSMDIDDSGNLYMVGYSTSTNFGADEKGDPIVFKYSVK